MSSLTRRIQRARHRDKPIAIGQKVGVNNEDDKPKKQASRSQPKPAIPAGNYRIQLP